MYYRLRRNKVVKLRYRIGTSIKDWAERKGIKSLVGFGYRMRGALLMNNWKKLKIDNLPPDILTGDYEFRVFEDGYHRHFITPILLLGCLLNGDSYQYRKPEPLPPTHKEIMTKWWKRGDGLNWFKVNKYRNGVYISHAGNESDGTIRARTMKKWEFAHYDSADIPPEAE